MLKMGDDYRARIERKIDELVATAQNFRDGARHVGLELSLELTTKWADALGSPLLPLEFEDARLVVTDRPESETRRKVRHWFRVSEEVTHHPASKHLQLRVRLWKDLRVWHVYNLGLIQDEPAKYTTWVDKPVAKEHGGEPAPIVPTFTRTRSATPDVLQAFADMAEQGRVLN